MEWLDLGSLPAVPASTVLWLSAAAAALAYVLGLAVDIRQTGRRSRALFLALNDSARGTTAPNRAPGPRGFDAEVQPPPEPFARFVAEHHTAMVLSPLVWLFPATLPRSEFLLLHARLPEPPTQELAWARARTPPAAVASQPDPELWTLHRLDFVQAEYATRGLNPNGVRHAFTELQVRLGPQLEQIVVSRDDEWHVRVVVRSPALVMADVPTLVNLMRALGRAARL